MIMKKFIAYTAAAMILAACSKNDNPTPAPSPTPTPTPPVSIDGAEVKAEVGGATMPNAVFVNLLDSKQTAVKRDAWDLGFYCGDDDYRVVINNSLQMAVKPLESIDITEPQTEDANVKVDMNVDASNAYVDSPFGHLKGDKKGLGTAIDAIAAKAVGNRVYLVNMGYAVETKVPESGYDAEGAHRGWKKIRITRVGKNYKLQYADLADSTAKSIIVKKDPKYNFVYVSLATGKEVKVAPEKSSWDLCFTPRTIYATGPAMFLTYEESETKINTSKIYFAIDLVLTNYLGGTRAAQVMGTAEDYAAYTLAKAKAANLDDPKLANAMEIAANWRNVFDKITFSDRFYVVKAASGNYYKVKFTNFINEKGQRGYPVFEYKLLK